MTTASPFPLEATAADAQAAIAEEFAFFSDWSERYQYLIDLGHVDCAVVVLGRDFQVRVHGAVHGDGQQAYGRQAGDCRYCPAPWCAGD